MRVKSAVALVLVPALVLSLGMPVRAEVAVEKRGGVAGESCFDRAAGGSDLIFGSLQACRSVPDGWWFLCYFGLVLVAVPLVGVVALLASGDGTKVDSEATELAGQESQELENP